MLRTVWDATLWGLGFVFSIAVLVKAADFFVVAAEHVGLAMGLSRFAVGVTVLAVGTSLPELGSALAAVWLGDSAIAVGTAVGSNVTNILLILGASALVGRGLKVDYELVRVDLPFLFGAALLLAFFAFDGELTRIEGLICLAALAVYVAYAVTDSSEPHTTVAAAASELPLRATAWSWWDIAWLVAGAVGMHVGAHGTVTSVSELAQRMGIGAEIIATSAVALGTSLPELSVSLRSARDGKPDLAVGNVIGSNIFNVLGVLGAASMIGALTVPASLTGFALPAMLAVTVLCFFVLQEREMTRWDGWLLLVLYAGFCLQLFQT